MAVLCAIKGSVSLCKIACTCMCVTRAEGMKWDGTGLLFKDFFTICRSGEEIKKEGKVSVNFKCIITHYLQCSIFMVGNSGL